MQQKQKKTRGTISESSVICVVLSLLSPRWKNAEREAIPASSCWVAAVAVCVHCWGKTAFAVCLRQENKQKKSKEMKENRHEGVNQPVSQMWRRWSKISGDRGCWCLTYGYLRLVKNEGNDIFSFVWAACRPCLPVREDLYGWWRDYQHLRNCCLPLAGWRTCSLLLWKCKLLLPF